MGSHGDEPLSMECVKRSDMFPRTNPVCDDPTVQQIPFPLLCGENGLFLGRCAEGVVTLTNFRLHICQRKSFLNIPLRLIESVESRDMFYLVILCKDATTVRCKFPCNEGCQLWLKRITECTRPPKDLTKIFAFAFFSHGTESEESLTSLPQSSMSAYDQAAQLCVSLDKKYAYSFGKDVERMMFDTSRKKVWRILQTNEDYSLCQSYPKHHIVPASITDEQIQSVAGFRSGARFPSVVWRDQRNGAVIVRCSQPELGWLGWRNTEDELLAKAIPEACAQDAARHTPHLTPDAGPQQQGETEGQGSRVKMLTAEKMLLLDCRSYTAAVANRAKGGGCESEDYYTNCEIKFMNMANIHSIRKSFHALRLLCSNFPDQNWMSNLETSKWLQYLGAILYSTQVVVSAIEDARPVLVHCSDGWDRTAQISSLAQLLLDPFYRTIQGFQWLVEREWLQFGHKFADRCGHTIGGADVNEQSPVFLQWLDCVYQVTRQFPCHFQFNEAFLIKLVQHTYSCLFGTFLFNTCQEREKEAMTNPTSSIWTLLHSDNIKFHNPLFNENAREILKPEWSLHRLSLWSSVYLSNNSLKTSSADEFAASVEQADQMLTPDDEPGGLTKTRSCENLPTATTAVLEVVMNPARRSSDPNIGCRGDTMALLSKEVDCSQGRAHDDASSSASSDQDAADTPGSTKGQEEGETDRLTGGEGGESSPANNEACDDCNQHELWAEHVPSDHFGGAEQNTIPQNHETDNSVEHGETERGQPISKNVLDSNVEDDVEDETREVVFMNGHVSSEEAQNSSSVEVDTQTSDIILTNGGSNDLITSCNVSVNLKAVDSSTDTLTEETDQVLLLKSRRRFNTEPSVSSVAADSNDNGHADSDSEEEMLLKGRRKLDAASVESLKLLIEQNCSISTSTTDISDSHVCGGANGMTAEVVSRAAGLGLYIRCNSGLCGVGGVARRTPPSSEASPSVCSLVATPINSYTPPSTCSPTPGSDGKSCESPLVRQLNSVARHLDCDGLTTFVDPGVERVQQMMADYQRRIAHLETRLAATTAHLNQVMPAYNGAGRAFDPQDYMNIAGELSDGGELSSLGTESNPASDVSWEQVDERDSRITLWVPDHVVTNCAACGGPFWLGRRKHHCRNCGKVYCYTCSNFFAPVPTQHLAEPVRLCGSCFNQLHPSGPGAASDDSRITVGAE